MTFSIPVLEERSVEGKLIFKGVCMFIKEYDLTSLVLSCPLFLAEWTLCSIQRTFTFWHVPFRMDSMQYWANVHLFLCPY